MIFIVFVEACRSYVFSLWSLNEDAYAPTFRLRAVITYTQSNDYDSNTEEFTADFSPPTEEWQLASVQFSKSKYRTVESIEVSCDVENDRGKGTCKFYQDVLYL